jgi:hypothetical protein
MKGPHRAHWTAAAAAFALGLLVVVMNWPGLLLTLVLAAWACIATVWLAVTRESLRVLQNEVDRVARLGQINAETAESHAQTLFSVTRGPGDRRIGDSDRDAVLAQLRARYVTGHLTLPEFDARSTAALTAVARADLAALVRDLP